MSQKGVYSADKAVWWYAREGRLPDAPKQVHWVLSDLCNEDCSFCSYRVSGNPSNELFMVGAKAAAYGHDNPVRWVNTERAMRLVEEIRSLGVLAVQFTGGGEPTVHPDHEKIFEAALAAGLRCALVSNGYRWRPAIFDVLPHFDWVRVSIDAGTAETYARMRRVPETALWKVLANVRALRTSLGAHPTVLGVGYVVTPDNWEEIPQGVALAKEHGAHNVRISAVFGPENELAFTDIHEKIVEKIHEARGLEDPTFTVYDNFGSRLSDLRQHEPDYPTCAYQNYVAYLGGDLKVYRCCILSYSRRGLVAGGDISNQRFDDYWRSEARRNDYEKFDARGCPRCMFNDRNRAWLYVAGATEADVIPRHIEWV